MSKPKSKYPPGLFNESIEKQNEIWLEEFKKATNNVSGYYQNIRNFLRFKEFADKPFSEFTLGDVWLCISMMLDNNCSPHTVNTLVSELSEFRKFLIGRHPNEFKPPFLEDLPTLIDKKTPPENSSDAEALTLEQLSYVRKYNRRADAPGIEDEYIFEIFFQLGIDKEQLKICHPRYVNNEQSSFVYNNKRIEYNHKIADLLEKAKPQDEFVWNTNTANYYFRRITKYLRDNNQWHKDRDLGKLDLKKSHDAYIIRCPVCKRLLENIAENWILARTGIDEDYHIVCTHCKGMPA